MSPYSGMLTCSGPESKRFIPKIMEAGTPCCFIVEYTPTCVGEKNTEKNSYNSLDICIYLYYV